IIEPFPGARWRSIARYAQGIDTALRAAGASVQRVRAPWWNPPSVLAGVARQWHRSPLVGEASAGNVDVVHIVDQALGHHARRFAGLVPTAVTVHDLLSQTLPAYYRGPAAPLKRLLIRKPLRSLPVAHLLVTPSQFTARELANFPNIDPHRIVTVPNPLDPTFVPIDRTEARARLARRGIALPNRPLILSVGHTGRYKNLPALLAAMERPPLSSSTLVRVGPYLTPRRFPSARTLSHRGRLIELGAIEDHVLRELYAATDVLAQPSVAEGFGYPVLEAMAMGLPVVASDGGALPEIVEDAGLLVPLAANDFPGALAAAL
ncbi:MAG: hypothetical protein C4321_02020, partial [Chloroflexota bacterium]